MSFVSTPGPARRAFAATGRSGGSSSAAARPTSARAVSGACGSEFGLAAADGAVRWLEERGRGYVTPGGVVPIVPAAVIYDLVEGDPGARPGPEDGYAACERASEGIPARGRVVAALAIANSFGDVVGAGGEVLGGPRADDGSTARSAELIATMEGPPDWTELEERNTTLVCVMTDAPLDKPACTRVARMGSGGVARAVDPVFSDADGDVVFCLAGGTGTVDRFVGIQIGTVAATVTAAAIRDAVESS